MAKIAISFIRGRHLASSFLNNRLRSQWTGHVRSPGLALAAAQTGNLEVYANT